MLLSLVFFLAQYRHSLSHSWPISLHRIMHTYTLYGTSISTRMTKLSFMNLVLMQCFRSGFVLKTSGEIASNERWSSRASSHPFWWCVCMANTHTVVNCYKRCVTWIMWFLWHCVYGVRCWFSCFWIELRDAMVFYIYCGVDREKSIFPEPIRIVHC